MHKRGCPRRVSAADNVPGMTDEQDSLGHWVSTGHVISVGPNMSRIPPYDKRTGAHLWTWCLLYRAVPGAETPMLDRENLLAIEGIGCYHCEEIYSARLAERRCPGVAVHAVTFPGNTR